MSLKKYIVVGILGSVAIAFIWKYYNRNNQEKSNNEFKQSLLACKSKPIQHSDTFFDEQEQHLISEIVASQIPKKILLIEGAPGIGKGTALHTLVSKQPFGIYIKLSKYLLPLDAMTAEQFDCDISHLFRFAFQDAFVAPAQVNIFDYMVQLCEYIKKTGNTLLIVVDDIQLLFRNGDLLSVYSDIIPMFSVLLQLSVTELANVIICSSSKSVLLPMKKLFFNDQLVFRSIESAPDEQIVSFLLEKVNKTLSQEKKFTDSTANYFVKMFGGNMIEVGQYCASELDVEDYIDDRKREFLSFLEHNLPETCRKMSYNPFSPPRPRYAAFKEFILDMIMKNGTLPLYNMDSERFQLVQTLIERNFLRWSHQKESSPNSSGSSLIEFEGSDPFAYMKRGDTEVVWFNRLVADVCEEWFNTTKE